MAENPNSSFIPKRGPVKKRRRSATKQVYVFTIISYVAIFAAVIGSAGVYFYSEYVNSQLAAEVTELNKEMSSFNNVDMQRVKDFDVRLSQAGERLNNSASIIAILNALEGYTVDTITFLSLSLKRAEDTEFALNVDMKTDSFDSTI